VTDSHTATESTRRVTWGDAYLRFSSDPYEHGSSQHSVYGAAVPRDRVYRPHRSQGMRFRCVSEFVPFYRQRTSGFAAGDCCCWSIIGRCLHNFPLIMAEVLNFCATVTWSTLACLASAGTYAQVDYKFSETSRSRKTPLRILICSRSSHYVLVKLECLNSRRSHHSVSTDSALNNTLWWVGSFEDVFCVLGDSVRHTNK
jgi:hypothetical protein